MKLLPHKVQKPAWIIILVCLVLVFTIIFLSLVAATKEGNPSFTSVSAWLDSNTYVLAGIIVIAFTLSLAALLFSEEKVEDEMISHLRLRAVAISAIIVIAFKLIEQIVWVLLPWDFTDSFRDIRNDFRGGGVDTMIILYLLIFKRSIRKYSNGTDEEQS